MFYLLTSIAIASIPDSAWRAAERENYQQSIFNEQQIVELLQQSCREGHRPSCKWKKQRTKRPKTQASRDQYFTETCAKGDPWGCVIAGWHNSQLENLPGYHHPNSRDPSLAARQFSQACEQHSTRGCVELAKLELTGEGIKQQFPTAFKRLQDACNMDQEEACYTLGILYGDAVGVEQDLEISKENFRISCEAGLGKSCSELALFLLSDATDFASANKAVKLYEKGCDLGSTEACRRLGQHYEEGLGTEIDIDRSAKLYAMACQSYNAEACDKLGVLYSEGRGVKTDLSKAIALFNKACEAKNPFSCYNLAASYELGQGVTIDLQKARSLLSLSCVYGSGRGCFTYGLWQESGKGGETQTLEALNSYGRGCELQYGKACINGGIIAYKNSIFKDAKHLYTLGCELNEIGACSSLALLYEQGEGVPQDLEQAKSLYQYSCQQGDGLACRRFQQLRGTIESVLKKCQDGDLDSCYDAAVRYDTGDFAIKNIQIAVDLVDRACQENHFRSCVKLGYYLLEGRGVNRDEKKAHKYYSLACQNKEITGCHSLGLMYAEGRFVERDINKAIHFLEQSCDGGQGASCGAVGLLLRLQSPPDMDQSLAYCQKGCRLGDMDSCAQEAYIFTQPPRSDLPHAAHLFKRYCSQNHGKSCYNYAVMLYNGQGLTQNKDLSFSVMKHACSLGEMDACKSIGQ